MPGQQVINAKNIQAILKLKDEQASFKGVKKKLFPNALGVILRGVDTDAPTVEQIWAVSEFYLHHNLFRRQFTPGLTSFMRSPLARGLLVLHSINLLDGVAGRTNFEALLKHPQLGSLVSILEMIKSRRLLKKDNAQGILNSLLALKDIDSLTLSVRLHYFSGILKQHYQRYPTEGIRAFLRFMSSGEVCLKAIQEVTSPRAIDVDRLSTPFPFFTPSAFNKNKISSNDVEQSISYTTQV